MQKFTTNDVSLICSKHGHTYIDGYTTARQKFNCLCSCGRNWRTILSTIQQGSTCKVCGSDNRTRSSESVADELSSYGLTLLKPYVNYKTHVTYECDCTGIGRTTLACIRAGIRCGRCKEMYWRNYFLEHGCEIVVYASAKDITYLCICGEVHNLGAISFRDGSKQCPKCTTWRYKNPVAPMRRPGLYSWKKQILTRDSFQCIICTASDDLCVHHIEAYSAKPELVCEITNGATLCSMCHIQLHIKYGWNVGKENLNFELVRGGKSVRTLLETII